MEDEGGERGAKREKLLRSAVHVDNLPLETTDDQLRSVFSVCGPVSVARVNRPEGFAPRAKTGLVVFEFAESALLASSHLAGMEVMGHCVTVDVVSNPRDTLASHRETQLAQLEEWEVAMLRDKLSSLNTSRKKIGELMVFAIENASRGGAIVELILEAMKCAEISANRIIALVYLVNDILANSSGTLFSLHIEGRLCEISLALRTVISGSSGAGIGRISAKTVSGAVKSTIEEWARHNYAALTVQATLHVMRLDS